MADETADPQPLAQPLAQPVKEANWALRGVLLVALLALLGVAYVVGTTVVPRWWAHRVGDRVDGSLTAGAFYGLFIGFVFTLLPLMIARQALRRMPWKGRVLVLVLAIAAAAPNLMTLSIVLGSGNGAHAGDRILDTEGDGFRAGSSWGAVAAAVAGDRSVRLDLEVAARPAPAQVVEVGAERVAEGGRVGRGGRVLERQGQTASAGTGST